MPITLITGPANAGKARAVMEAVRRHVTHGEQPLLVLPTGADADRYRHELAHDGPATGVSVCLFGGLLDRIARSAAVEDPALARAPLSSGAREQMLFTLATKMQDAPGTARRLARALGGAIAELQAAEITPGQLQRGLGFPAGPGEPRARMLLEMHERYNRDLVRHGLLDAELRARRALDVLRRRPALWRAGGRPIPVLLYGFDDLTALEMDAVQTLGQAVDAPLTIALAYEPGRVAFAGRAWAFQELSPKAARHVQLAARSDYYASASRTTLHRLERELFEAQDTARHAGEGEQLSLDEEWGACEPAVVEPSAPPSADGVRLLRGGCPSEEARLIATEVRALIDQGISPEEIAIVHRAPASFADLLTEALDAAGVPYAIASRVKLADTALGRAWIGLLVCACEGLDGLPQARLGDLLAWLRAPGLLERARLADRLEEQALRTGIRDAAGARKLWEQANWTLDAIDRVRESASEGVESLIERAHRELIRLYGAPRLGQASVLDSQHEEPGLALEAGLKAIAALRELAGVAPRLVGGVAGVIDALRAAELSQAGHAQGSAVAVLDPLALRARRVRVLFACGLQEGVFPRPAAVDPIYSEEMRARLAAVCGPQLGRRLDSLAAERYLLYAIVSRPEERLYLSWHESGEDGVATPPSLFLDDVCDLFDAKLRSEAQEMPVETQTAPVSSAIGSGACGTAAPLPQQLRAELAQRELWSASALERWAACPVSWFVERLLRAEDLEPEREPLTRGSLAHAVLGDVLEGLREKTGSARLSPSSLFWAQSLMREALERHERERPLSVAPERLPAVRRRLEADLERYLAHAAGQSSPFEPTHLELSFGFPEEPGGLPALKLAEGVLLRGRIDRVDVGPGGQAIVYDYKSGRTGSGHSGSRWVQERRFQMALYMKAVRELLGMDVIGGLYQPLGGSDLRARGALACDARVELSCVRTDSYQRAELEELVEAGCQAAVQAARQAQAAEIEPRPQTCAYGGGCLYPTICRCDR